MFTDTKENLVSSNVKVMLTVFFDILEAIHQEFLPDGQTINRSYYLELSKRL